MTWTDENLNLRSRGIEKETMMMSDEQENQKHCGYFPGARIILSCTNRPKSVERISRTYAYRHVDAPIQRTNRNGDPGDLTLQLKHLGEAIDADSEYSWQHWWKRQSFLRLCLHFWILLIDSGRRVEVSSLFCKPSHFVTDSISHLKLWEASQVIVMTQ